MVVGREINNTIVESVARIYEWLDMRIDDSASLAGVCQACGKCCDFEAFDHRLYVTTPEVMYLAAKLGAEDIKLMSSSRCPYREDSKCGIHQYRFASCRIFCCNGDTDFQSRLAESVLKKFKSLCLEYQLPYRYADLATALNTF